MFQKTFLIAAVLAVVNSRTIQLVPIPYNYIDDSSNVIQDDAEDSLSEHPFESVYPEYNFRIKRQVGITNNLDGSSNVFIELPLKEGANNKLSANGAVIGSRPGGSFDSASVGVSLANENGNSFSVSGKRIPSYGNQITASSQLNLINTNKQNMNVNGFATTNLLDNPNARNYNTYGGGVDYKFNNKVGASLDVSHTPYYKNTDVSAKTNLNVFSDKKYGNLDFAAGARRSFSPYNPNHSWRPNVWLGYSKSF